MYGWYELLFFLVVTVLWVVAELRWKVRSRFAFGMIWFVAIGIAMIQSHIRLNRMTFMHHEYFRIITHRIANNDIDAVRKSVVKYNEHSSLNNSAKSPTAGIESALEELYRSGNEKQ